MSRDPARSRSAIAPARTPAGSRPASSAPRRVRHSHFAWWPGCPAVAGRQAVHEQVAVGLVPGRGGLGGPDRVQDGQVVGVGQGLAAGLGGGVLLAVAVQHAGQHGERVRRGSGGGAAGPPGAARRS